MDELHSRQLERQLERAVASGGRSKQRTQHKRLAEVKGVDVVVSTTGTAADAVAMVVEY